MLACEHLPPDARGEIAQLEIEGVKFNVLFSRAGSLRGGDIHPCEQYDLVINGKVSVQLPTGRKNAIPGRLLVIPANVPHLLTFLRDTVMLEWWQGSFEAKYYEPYRKQVEEYLRAHPSV